MHPLIVNQDGTGIKIGDISFKLGFLLQEDIRW